MNIFDIVGLVVTGSNSVLASAILTQTFVATPHWDGKDFRLTVARAAHDRGATTSKKLSILDVLSLALPIYNALFTTSSSLTPITMVDLYPSFKGVDLEIKLEYVPKAAVVPA